MKIILKGTETELINTLRSFGIPNKVIFDDGSQFLCGDIAGRGHRKKSARTFKVNKEQIGDIMKKYLPSKEVPNKPEPLKMEESKELTEALESIDDMIDTMGKLIICIADSNDDFVCIECLYVTKRLYQLMRKYAREEDADRIRDEFKKITGRDIND